MPIQPHHKANFDTILKAGSDGNLALLECKEFATGNNVCLIIARGSDGENLTMSPLAKMLDDANPFTAYGPPGSRGPEGCCPAPISKARQLIKDYFQISPEERLTLEEDVPLFCVLFSKANLLTELGYDPFILLTDQEKAEWENIKAYLKENMEDPALLED